MRRLIYFTDRYPFLEEWHPNEIQVLASRFDEILIAPLEGGKEVFSSSLPANIKIARPVFTSGTPRFELIKALCNIVRRGDIHFPELLLSTAFSSVRNIKKWLVSSSFGQAINSSEVFNEDVFPFLNGSYLYFFWGLGYAEVLPYLSSELRAVSMVRFHRYDLYRDQNEGYVPYQRAVVRSAAVLAPVSESGVRHLAEIYPAETAKLVCRRLGCVSKGRSKRSVDGVFRIVSCAFANPIKRLHLIPKGLSKTKLQIEWTHIGDGVEMKRLREICSRLDANVKVNILGNLAAPDVKKYYMENCCDLFVSVSASEGIPVSIMEALAAGIPVMATNAGGTSEIVNSDVGYLLPLDFDDALFANRIECFSKMNDVERGNLSARCIMRHARLFDSAVNAEATAQTILQMAQWL